MFHLPTLERAIAELKQCRNDADANKRMDNSSPDWDGFLKGIDCALARLESLKFEELQAQRMSAEVRRAGEHLTS